jgi:hypothetical protein
MRGMQTTTRNMHTTVVHMIPQGQIGGMQRAEALSIETTTHALQSF